MIWLLTLFYIWVCTSVLLIFECHHTFFLHPVNQIGWWNYNIRLNLNIKVIQPVLSLKPWVVSQGFVMAFRACNLSYPLTDIFRASVWPSVNIFLLRCICVSATLGHLVWSLCPETCHSERIYVGDVQIPVYYFDNPNDVEIEGSELRRKWSTCI